MTRLSSSVIGAEYSTAHSRKAARLTAEMIVKLGAVIVTATPRFQCHLLGHVAWLGDQHLFWFEATGSAAEAAHCLEYNEICRVAHRGVVFFQREQIAGYICTLATANTNDEPWMRAMHQLWTIAVPRCQTEVCEYCERLDPGSGPRSCAWRLVRCAHTRGYATSLPTR